MTVGAETYGRTRRGELFAAVQRALAGVLPGPLRASLEAERARWFVWLPVLFGAGIVAYFRLPAEPPLAAALAAPVVAGALAFAWRGDAMRAAVVGSLIAAALGFAAAKVRSDLVGAPVLEREMRATNVEGWVELAEPRAARGVRLTLRLTAVKGLDEDALPKRARIGVRSGAEDLKPGDFVSLRARLSPPAPPSLPGDYDFARWAWFQGLGAVGFAVAAPRLAEPPGPVPASLALAAAIERVRLAIGARIRAALPGEAGAIANALITGDRGGISAETTDAFRDSGLLHIMSISGLHMAVMAGAVFALLRTAFAAFPALALRYPTKKWAAAAAAIAAFAYLLISGAASPTVRAFLMIAIMFLAVLADRPALAMRNVAIAALVILGLWPESVLDVGFQMSFAAVVSLVAVYEVVRERIEAGERRGVVVRLAAFFGGIVLSTLVASLAVAPFAAYHFHKSQQFAILANLVAIPICNLVVMPAGLATLVAMPLGLEAVPLAIMAWGIAAMTWAAQTVAALPGAVGRIPAISDWAFSLMAAGGIWLALWRTRWRALGLGAAVCGLALAPARERPDMLVGHGGELVALRTANGALAALPGRRFGFDLKRWLEHDGDARSARDAARGEAFACDGTGCIGAVKGVRVAVATHPAALADDCKSVGILIATVTVADGCKGPRVVLDWRTVRREGTHALYVETSGEIRVETVAQTRGDRPWALRATKLRPSGKAARRAVQSRDSTPSFRAKRPRT